MRRIEQIMAHSIYQCNQMKIENAERERVFCKHGLSHALDVARILYIMVLEHKLPYKKDVVYAAALLHDIGRYEQYKNQTPHHEAGADISNKILEECGFDKNEILLVTEAVRAHHKAVEEEYDSLNYLLYRADKLSRNCYHCEACKECYWEPEKRNQTVFY